MDPSASLFYGGVAVFQGWFILPVHNLQLAHRTAYSNSLESWEVLSEWSALGLLQSEYHLIEKLFSPPNTSPRNNKTQKIPEF